MSPTIDELALQIGDEIGHDESPDCCTEPMPPVAANGDLTYRCDNCGAEVEVDELGLVSDIRERA
ncbi:hypothetical protein GTY41_03730 [Streptomyces sp. SID685]|uniref:hypothetical protein n=1 Tax=Streptomyces sp. SID685 TaxID=2690322 RepID=UPI00137226CC|nr:hypothetical protein [Streptomyces sp. SID685]MYR84075.1 hypothetical protein [Streptomyces sp. SID685]